MMNSDIMNSTYYRIGIGKMGQLPPAVACVNLKPLAIILYMMMRSTGVLHSVWHCSAHFAAAHLFGARATVDLRRAVDHR